VQRDGDGVTGVVHAMMSSGGAAPLTEPAGRCRRPTSTNRSPSRSKRVSVSTPCRTINEHHIAYVSDDMVVMQALVASGMGVTILPGLALRAHRARGIHTTELPDRRRIFAATYGDPPDPPATTALIETIQSVL
jgi:DNA-binding transcriptional LysR family regulator